MLTNSDIPVQWQKVGVLGSLLALLAPLVLKRTSIAEIFPPPKYTDENLYGHGISSLDYTCIGALLSEVQLTAAFESQRLAGKHH